MPLLLSVIDVLVPVRWRYQDMELMNWWMTSWSFYKDYGKEIDC